MSTKHNCRHNRSRSNYHLRLQDRGLSRSPIMRGIDSLRRQYPNISIRDRDRIEIPRAHGTLKAGPWS